ncbi:MAG: hypothetical protein ATN34_05500 [Epulopiscium sp. Nele67-Bin002]|nr:MAG: hypothetical protein ATN34_05500 [Epulopiscium sp. Nele67-Bin002]
MRGRIPMLVVGCARSGIGASKLANSLGYKVALYDDKKFEDFSEETKQVLKQLESEGIELLLGTKIFKEDIELVVVSPGVPLEIPVIEYYKSQGIEVIGEFEFASAFCKAPIVGITGTNGKTTTTTMVGEILKSFNPNTYVVGNIGTAFSEEVQSITEDAIVAAELSSFQLETILTLECQVAAILNISPDHLNRHHTMENYIKAKFRIFENGNGILVLNHDDPELIKLVGKTNRTQILFSSTTKLDKGAYVDDGTLCYDAEPICEISKLHILGKHNIENTLAAIAITKALGVPSEIIKKVLLEFRGVEHRIEYINTIKGIKFYNDSKATNVGAAIPAIHAMTSPIRLIGGGMDKEVEFDEWVELFNGKVAKVYLIGETTNKIIETCKAHDFHSYGAYKTLDEAIQAAYNEAQEGECVLLSPACASWDMFESYEQRGDLFRAAVNTIDI